ncbi:hypothetical protein [Paraburkholderia aspalathi]|uniref:hypothetical protein n=1 Tax=Paraburkholderia aspalathi TaxID=1324617 RepID=UPI001BAD3B5D|nr:hypothetical protein [Paraburkholderia aspalathi]
MLLRPVAQPHSASTGGQPASTFGDDTSTYPNFAHTFLLPTSRHQGVRGVVKNSAQITTRFALGNLWMARNQLRKA